MSTFSCGSTSLKFSVPVLACIGMLLFIAGQATPAHADARSLLSQTSYVKVNAQTKPVSASRGARSMLVIAVAVSPGYHINSNHPSDEFLIATKVTLSAAPRGIELGTPVYPPAKTISTPASDKPMSVYTGKIDIKVPVTISRGARPGHYLVSGSFYSQGCTSTACFAPKNLSFSAPLIVK